MYTPQVGNSMEEKNDFWQELDALIESVSKQERIVLGAELNRHVGKGNIGDEEIMGRYGAGTRNEEGRMVVDFAKRMDLAVINTYFKTKDEHRVTHKSGGKSTQVDYVMCRRRDSKEMCTNQPVHQQKIFCHNPRRNMAIDVHEILFGCKHGLKNWGKYGRRRHFNLFTNKKRSSTI